MPNETYQLYTIAKKKFHFNYRGINVEDVLAIDLWQWSAEIFLPYSLHRFTSSMDMSFLKGKHSDHIAFFDINREDHRKTYYNILNKISDVYENIDVSSSMKDKHRFSIKNILIASFFLPKTRIFTKIFSYRLRICSRVCYILNTIDDLYAARPANIKKLLSFSPIHTFDNLLCQYYKNTGTITFGLSHGTPFLYSKNIPIDCLNYENLNTDYCLVWGQMTKDEYVKFGIPESSVLVAGYPKQITRRSIRPHNPMKKCLVLLSRVAYDDSNRSLLDLLKKHSSQLDFHLKLHPSCNFDEYLSIAHTNGYTLIDRSTLLSSCMDNGSFDFAIAVNTSAYYEILAAGIPCLRFYDDVYDLSFGDSHDVFSSEHEFEIAYRWLIDSIKNNIYQTSINRTINYALTPGIDNYRHFLI